MGRTVKCFKQESTKGYNPYLCYVVNTCYNCDAEIRMNYKMAWKEMYRMLHSTLITGLYRDTIYRYYDRKPYTKL